MVAACETSINCDSNQLDLNSLPYNNHTFKAMKKKNSSTGLLVTVIILICVVAGFSLKDLGFFNRPPAAPPQPQPTAQSDMSAKADAMQAAAGAPGGGKPGPRPATDPRVAPPASTKKYKPVPSSTSTGSQWYADEATKENPK